MQEARFLRRLQCNAVWKPKNGDLKACLNGYSSTVVEQMVNYRSRTFATNTSKRYDNQRNGTSFVDIHKLQQRFQRVGISI